MVPQSSLTVQPNESEEIIEDYEFPETPENVTHEVQRSSVVSSLISGAKSVALDVSSYWAKVLTRYLIISKYYY